MKQEEARRERERRVKREEQMQESKESDNNREATRVRWAYTAVLQTLPYLLGKLLKGLLHAFVCLGTVEMNST